MRSIRNIALVATALFLASTAAQATRTTSQFDSLTVFGDSLVDAGNYYINTGGGYPSEASGYFMGRNTNGYDYTDLLSLKLFGTPTTPSEAGGANYGLGGAHSYEAAGQISQYEQHLASTSTSFDPNGLYVVNFGGNDIFYADTLSAPDRDQYLQFAAQTIANSVQELDSLGARNILVTGMPIVLSPSSAIADGYLKSDLAGLSLNSSTTLLQYSLIDFFNTALTDPSSVGLPPLRTDVSCMAANSQADCAGYFFFDGIHPTAEVDQALFADMDAKLGLTASLSAVPEPGSWSMTALGMLLLGAMTWFRRRRPAIATPPMS